MFLIHYCNLITTILRNAQSYEVKRKSTVFYTTGLGTLAQFCWILTFPYLIEREKFCPGLGLEPGPLAFRANALPLSYPGQVRVHDRINLLELSFLTSGLTNCVVTMSHGGKHSLLNDNYIKGYLVIRPLNEIIVKICFSNQGRLLVGC